MVIVKQMYIIRELETIFGFALEYSSLVLVLEYKNL